MNDTGTPILSAEDLMARVTAGDSLAAIEQVCAMPDAVAATDLFAQAVMDAYWKKKDLVMCVLLGRAGMQHAISAAFVCEQADPERARTLRGKAKAIAYNLASFTWPGWDEPGIECAPPLVAIGFDAAKTNVRLARELNRGDLAMSRGVWMLAGHHLARGELDQAAKDYASARDHAVAAKSSPDEALCDGFWAMVRVLQHANDASATRELEQAIAKLKTLGDDGQEFIRQIETAHRIFESATPSPGTRGEG